MGLENINLPTLESFQFIANCNREKGSKYKRQEFYNKFSKVKHLRSQIYTSKLSFYLTSVDENNLLQRIHSIVNDSAFDLDREFNSKVFLLGLPPKLYSWLKYSNFETIYNQITNWFTASYLFEEGKSTIIEKQVHEPLLFKIQQLKKVYEKSITQDVMNNSSLQQKLYIDVSRKLTGSEPPDFLEYFGSVPYHDEWGINTQLNFNIAVAYLREDDWEHIVVNGKDDDMHRAESNSLLLEQWKMVYQHYPNTKSNLIKKLEFKTKQDYLYLIKEGNLNRYKIGWTTNPDIEQKRLSQMQTGNSNILKVIGSFEISSKKIETAIHNHFRLSNIHREWFQLDEKEVDNILSVDWRKKHNYI